MFRHHNAAEYMYKLTLTYYFQADEEAVRAGNCTFHVKVSLFISSHQRYVYL